MNTDQKIMIRIKELINVAPSGKRYSELRRELRAAFPDIPPNTIANSLGNFRMKLPHDYYLPVTGLYRNVRFKATDEVVPPSGGNISMVARIKEEDFYDRFSDWLVNELEEATKAISLGGNRFRDKWGTPDVIAVREAKRSDIIKTTTEIISAESKLDVAGLITAFGQCCSYKLFSHKSYLVIPRISSEEDLSRLDTLARIFGIGLVLFDLDNPNQPQFTIRARASREQPDMFYVNKYLRLIEDKLFP